VKSKPKHAESKPQKPPKKGIFKARIIKKRRKEDYCLNCDTKYSKEYNYCPNCGQENNHNRASFGTLIVDFFQNYFSLDSKFANSLLPFFFQPGYLVLKYLIISLLFFMVFSMVRNGLVEKSMETTEEVTKNIPEDQKVLLDEVLSGDLSEIVDDSTYRFDMYDKDSVLQDYSYSIQKPDSDNTFFTEENASIYMAIRKDMTYSVLEVIDTLDTSTLSDFQINLAKKAIRLDRAELPFVVSQLLKNLPIMMMLLIPFFALLLKLFYIRRNQLYIKHLIHTLYLHSFAYTIYGFAFLAAMYWRPGISFWIILGSLILVSTHSYISFLKVYQQSKTKTFFKFNIIGYLYSILLMIALFVEVFFSVITY